MQIPTSYDHNYKAYLLRCWIEIAEERTTWRFSLEPVGGGRRLGFSNLEALVDFLKSDFNRRDNAIFHKD